LAGQKFVAIFADLSALSSQEGGADDRPVRKTRIAWRVRLGGTGHGEDLEKRPELAAAAIRKNSQYFFLATFFLELFLSSAFFEDFLAGDFMNPKPVHQAM
jgi:hypothetical protein